jgi:hypothetical protein
VVAIFDKDGDNPGATGASRLAPGEDDLVMLGAAELGALVGCRV